MTAPEPGLVQVRRVGPRGSMAADHAFAVALVTLWLRVAQAGGSVGFVPPVTRPEVAARVAGVVEQLRQGHADAAALTQGRLLVGFGLIRPGVGPGSHTGRLESVMIDPDRQRRGLGRQLLGELLNIARERGLEWVDLSVRDGQGLETFYGPFGFTAWGRRPGALRVGPGDDRDEIFLGRPVN